VSHLSEQVARRMRVSEKECTDIRVAALLMDMANLQITARGIMKAVAEREDYDGAQHTVHATELVQAVGPRLTGAFPRSPAQSESGELSTERMPFGARIIRTVRAFDHLIHSVFGGAAISEKDALQELSSDTDADYHPAVLHALGEVLDAEGVSSTGTGTPATHSLAGSAV